LGTDAKPHASFGACGHLLLNSSGSNAIQLQGRQLLQNPDTLSKKNGHTLSGVAELDQ
jgi:hypothetical protein